ncbi:MAG TPA: hypothetical protein VFC46_02820, partial [Humisphaera sp.]|nr:hypothetical protein [Humisphaera sp.]
QESLDETTAADMAKEAANILARIGNDASTSPGSTSTGTFPDTTGVVVSPNAIKWNNINQSTPAAILAAQTNVSPFWNLTAGNLISSQDSRYAWIPFYRRGNAGAASQYSNFAQVIIIPVLDRNTGSFTGVNASAGGTAFDLGATPTGTVGDTPTGSAAGATAYSNLQGRMVLATFTANPAAGTPDSVLIQADPGPGGNFMAYPSSPPQSPSGAIYCAATGAYLIVADDNSLGNSASNLPSCNGYIYQLAQPVTPNNPTNFFLAPGNDMKNARFQPISLTKPPTGVRCFIIGRGFNNPNGVTSDVVLPYTPSGPAMEISAFSTFFRVQ